MKQNKNIFLSLGSASALIIATMFASCTKAELEAPVAKHGAEIRFGIEKNIISKPLTKSGSESDSRVLVEYNPNDPSSVGLSMTVVDGIETPKSNLPATKGTQVTQKEQLTAFDVASYFFADAAAEDGSFVFEDIVSDGVNTTNKTYYWPSFGEMNFIATYPVGLFGENGIKSIADADGHLQSFSYTIPETVVDQQDIMIAVTNDVDCTEGAPVPLQFKHLLAAVQFKVGKMIATRINSLTISGVKGGTVTMSYDSANDKWNYLASSNNATYSPVYLVDGTPNIDTYGMAEGNYITSNENGMVMFVMPQVLEGATLSVSYYEYITGTTHNDVVVSLPKHTWEAGKTVTYVITVDAETLQIEIPTPPDADAHYVRVDMDYDLTGFTQYAQGVNISNVTATATWLNDGSNTASNDKQSIRLKKSIKNASGTVTSTELTEMQKQGYFTDELWETIIDGDSKVGPKKSANPNILGDTTEELDLRNKGSLHLFIDENDGDTDRNGQLKITATVTVNGEQLDEPIILAQGNFKQLHPYWNNGIGVERFEDGNNHPYGFSYNRKVVYTNISGQEHLDSSRWDQFVDSLISWFLSLFGYTTDTVLPEIDEDIADDFVNVETENDKLGQEVIKTVTVDYTKLSNLKANNKAISQDGFTNTRDLYDFTGNIDLADLEEQLNNSLTPNVQPGVEATTGWKREVYGSNESNPEYYAAYVALTRNKMRELKTTIKGSGSNKDTYLYQASMHKENEGSGTNGVYEDGNEIIEWFLPSKEDAKNMKEVGTGMENTPISPLNGIYWSSTAGDDPVAESNTPGYAYTYTFNNNAYSTSNAVDRTLNHKVRAVRKKPTAN